MEATTPPDFKKGVGELRPGFIDIRAIDGVDLENGTISRDPRFANPKFTLREEVLDSLGVASEPKEVPPVEIWVERGGKVHLIDGDHRVVAALRHLQDDLDAGQSIDESPWRAIRATKFEGTERAAQIRTWTINLPTGRSVLNEREVVGVVKKAFDLGLTKEEVVAQIGRHSRKLVHDIDLIMNADSSVIESVLAGTLSILGGAYIAAEVPLDKQEEAVADYEAALEEAGGDHEAARANSGNKKSRTKPLKLPEIRELLWPDWINWQRMMENALVIDPTTMVRVGTLLRVLQMPVKDGYPFPGDTDETYLPYEDVVKALDPHYAISENEKNGTSEKKEKKTRISRKQREAAERAATTAPQAAHYDLDDE